MEFLEIIRHTPDIDVNYHLINMIFYGNGILPLLLQKVGEFSLQLILVAFIYTYTLTNIIYIGETTGDFNF